LDTLNLEFVSFSENKINKKLVLEFIMTLIMKRKETIVNEVRLPGFTKFIGFDFSQSLK